MSELAVKKRLARAKVKAVVYFRKINYAIIDSDNKTFCFIASRRREMRLVRVVVDRITDEDVHAARSVDVPDGCTREIFCQKRSGHEIREIEIGK